jgi:mannitol/fructose-specific phosphotransferase system IIA component (Ntr-type)
VVKDTVIKHKEVAVIFEESGPIIANYNALIIHPKSKPIAQAIVTYTTTKQQFTYSSLS